MLVVMILDEWEGQEIMVRGGQEKRYIREDSFLAKDRVISMVADCRVPVAIEEGQAWQLDTKKFSLKLPEFTLDL